MPISSMKAPRVPEPSSREQTRILWEVSKSEAAVLLSAELAAAELSLEDAAAEEVLEAEDSEAVELVEEMLKN